jgi:hypothetical protein
MYEKHIPMALNYIKIENVKLSLVLNKAPCHADIWGIGGIAPCIFNLSTNCDGELASCPGSCTPEESIHWIRG